MADFDTVPNTRVSGDNYVPGPDGHIRHPRDPALVWWEDAAGNRFWVRQSRWARWFDIKTERAPRERIRLDERGRKLLTRNLRAEGVRYKVRPVPFADWEADEGPWVPAEEEEAA